MSAVTEAAGTDLQTRRLLQALREADAVLRRESPSIPVGDERHFAVGVFDEGGAPLAVSRPEWLPSLAATVRAVLDAFGGALEPGDVAATNDPFAGGTHVNDFTVVRPAAAGGGYLAARIHTGDFGGERIGGTWPLVTEVWQEGGRLAPLRLQRGGRRDEDVSTLLRFNSRLPDLLERDLLAAAGAMDRLDAACPQQGVGSLATTLLDDARARVDALLAGLRTGSWTAPGRIRHCCSGIDVGFELRLTVGDGVAFEFPAEPDAVQGFVNSPAATTRSALLAPVAAALGSEACNAALLDAVAVALTPGSLFHARPPRATGHAPYITAAELARVASGLLTQAGLPEAPFAHWFALPPRVFVVPSCEDPACPFGRYDPDTHHTRYSPEVRP